MRSWRRRCVLVVCAVAAPVIGILAAATGASADQPRCGGDLPPACPVITSVTPSLFYSSQLPATLTLTGYALGNPTKASLMPVKRSLDFTANSSSSLTVTLPDDIREGTYTVEVIASGFTATSPHLAVLNGDAAPSQGNGAAVPPPPKAPATPGSHPGASAPAAPTGAPRAPASGVPWLLILAAGLLAGGLAAAYLGVKRRLVKGRHYADMDVALARLWALEEDPGMKHVYEGLKGPKRPPSRTLRDSIRPRRP